MSRHEGVSCDSCLKSNFTGRRYKCLICYDYDLCADCYEEGATSTRHSVDHPMQCILTRSDIELYFGGELLNSEQPQSFTCPYCKKMGFSDSTLLEHVSAEHTDTGLEVVCPVCAGLPGGEPNLVTDDFAGHLTLEHRTGPRDLISFLDEPSAIRHGGVRRIPGRALGGPRSRRSNMHFSSSSGLSALSPSGRESVDPIAELLSQLSGVRRGAPQTSQLQQLQMQIQLERQQVSASRQQLERLPRRQAHPMSTSNVNAAMQETISGVAGGSNLSTSSSNQQHQSNIGVNSINNRESAGLNSSQLTATNLGLSTGFQNNSGGLPTSAGDSQSQFLLAKYMTPSLNEDELELLEKHRADRSQFVQALMLSTLSNISLDERNDGQERGESQESNSGDTVNSEANNESSDDANNTTEYINTKDEKNQNLKGISGSGGNSTGLGDFQQHARMQVNQQQQTSPEDFVDEYSLQQQTYNNANTVNKKKLPTAGKSPSSSSVVLERRGRSLPTAGLGAIGGGVGVGGGGGAQGQQQQSQVKINREMKVVAATAANAAASKEIPDSR
ncbi:E3 ubiquitin-protein ligase Kcmf1 isoform X2 [Condylostylus longicornis]|uniref:E3 ubiquitin-protein ligase Kcmf1 isoform X2 n=1 Tax=Condylostylus longicornis TaxID=2530218 RepID=UPI00244E59E4|nr:E3 ubiquitin-protein ligase Kcmf1 isoform X2 [Condylostylus longicornis]XP_055375066.1 E3 ubiquitin-protein ligase Kcmf1 isoform X2 [Condylostylus longicornis]